MPTNLVELVKSYLTPAAVDRAAAYVGESGPATQKAVDSIVPTLVGALSSLGSTGGIGVQQIAQMLDKGRYDGGALANLGSLFSGGAPTQDAISAGTGILESLFGDKLSGVTDLIARSAGIRATSAASLMAMIAPLVMHVLGKQRAAAGGGVAALSSLLAEQQGFLRGLLPAGLTSLVGWPSLSGLGSAAAGASAAVAGAAARAPSAVAAAATPKSDMWIPLTALAAVILLALWAMWAGPPVGQVAREATRKLANLELPGGFKISVPEGAFNFSLATWLASTTDVTVPKRFVFDNLNFETGSTQLTPESRPTVDSLVAILKAYPAVVVVLEGHTDSTGDAVANKKLSLDRAVVVKAILVTNGVGDARISTNGYGPEKPIASNDTEEGRAKNRRLELVVEKR